MEKFDGDDFFCQVVLASATFDLKLRVRQVMNKCSRYNRAVQIKLRRQLIDLLEGLASSVDKEELPY